MGQSIEVKSVVLGDVALFDTDRTMTGQDGHGFDSIVSAQAEATTAARLAAALFASESAIDHVFVLSNQVTVRRTNDWSDERVGKAAEVIRNFFIFYEENRNAPMETVGD